MPRQLRIQYPGALYHVTACGDRREDIVHDEDDREMLLATLAGMRVSVQILDKMRPVQRLE